MDELQRIQPQLGALGYQILAVSGDLPEQVTKLVTKRNLTYTVLSDENLMVTRQFGIVFRQGRWLLPAPAVFIVGTDRRIRFHYVHPDYQVRLDPELLLAAAKAGRQ